MYKCIQILCSDVGVYIFGCILLLFCQVTGAYEDMFMSHSSWFMYAATMRIFKHYHFNVLDPQTSIKEMSFSSYPGKTDRYRNYRKILKLLVAV